MSTNNVRIPISENEKKNITKLLYNGTLPIPPPPNIINIIITCLLYRIYTNLYLIELNE